MGTVYRVTPAGVVSIVHAFTPEEGRGYFSYLMQGRDGVLYGRIERVYFQVTTAGDFNVLKAFAADENPPTQFLQGADGNFYGVTPRGGAFDRGTFVRMTPTGALTVLASFGTDAMNYPRTLIQGLDGNFWGTTGCDDCFPPGPSGGAIFKATPSGVLTKEYEFGAAPSTILQAPDGSFFGVLPLVGLVFRFQPGGPLTTVYSFPCCAFGVWRPSGPFIRADDGNFYGTTGAGGDWHAGILFKLTPAGVFETLRSLASGERLESLVQGPDGRIYGPIADGGHGLGAILRFSLDGTFAPPINFLSGPDGAWPRKRLLQRHDGNFYGTTAGGGLFDRGTVFSSTPAGLITRLHTFTGLDDGQYPTSGLVETADGILYGATGSYSYPGPSGTIYRMTPDGTVTTIVRLTNQVPTSVLAASDGNVYGTIDARGLGENTIFRLTPASALSTVYRFTYFESGLLSDLVEASDGFLYGMTSGRYTGQSTVFRVRKDGTAFATIAAFRPMADYEGPWVPDGLIRGTDGNLYGSVLSSLAPQVFRVSLDGAVTVVREFPGQIPRLLTQAVDGQMYGTFGRGEMFRMNVDGSAVVLLPPVPSDQYGQSTTTLVQGIDGFLYGTTSMGGGFNQGTLFRMSVPSAGLKAPTNLKIVK